MLPRTLGEAIDAFEADPLSEQVMGPLMRKTFIDVKRDEWLDYQSHVTDWERSRYMRFF
jgi:glutamine synthetase